MIVLELEADSDRLLVGGSSSDQAVCFFKSRLSSTSLRALGNLKQPTDCSSDLKLEDQSDSDSELNRQPEATVRLSFKLTFSIGKVDGLSSSPTGPDQLPVTVTVVLTAPLRGIAAIATLERFVVYCSCEQNISAAPPGAAQRARGIAQAVTVQ